VNQTKTSTIPGRRVLVGYWRQREHQLEPSTPLGPGVETLEQPVNDLQAALVQVRAQWERLRSDWTNKLLQMELRHNLVSPVFKAVIAIYCGQLDGVSLIERAFDIYPDDV
jgi:hypothetical protein